MAHGDLADTLGTGVVGEDLAQVDRRRGVDGPTGEGLMDSLAHLVAAAGDRGAEMDAKVGGLEPSGAEVAQGDAKDAGRRTAPPRVEERGRRRRVPYEIGNAIRDGDGQPDAA